ncbi:hypothetical protein GOBAR_AA23573 [Gossypium barbadense]|uniref:Uncharacterized protein n=1 Tax=Gossypium barbadense TaxID=3634 RepID=A0A2P5X178_GOSBA|nr:hypothetical protein GOBAR_AA23573 [Gossypium barbadense]
MSNLSSTLSGTLALAAQTGNRATKKVRLREEDPLDGGGMDIDSTANGSLSFKDMLMNENKNYEVLKDTDSNDINLKEEDVITKIIGGTPSVRFFDRVHGILSQSIKRTVIMKLLGW